MMAPSEMTVPAAQLDREFFALAQMEGVTDVDELNRVLDRAVGLRTFLTADDRIEKVATFVAQHFRENCAAPRLQGVPGGRSTEKPAPSTSAHWTSCCHRNGPCQCTRRIPTTLWRGPSSPKFQLSEEREKDVRLMFKKASEDPKLLIVTDKLLTGFDAPLFVLHVSGQNRCATMFFLQAIARVNRPYVDVRRHQQAHRTRRGLCGRAGRV